MLCWLERFLVAMHVPPDGSRRMKSGGEAAVEELRWLRDNIQMLGEQFRVGKQEDAHEFLVRLLDACVLSCLEGAGVQEGDPTRRDETTPLHVIFGGYLSERCVRSAGGCMRGTISSRPLLRSCALLPLIPLPLTTHPQAPVHLLPPCFTHLRQLHVSQPGYAARNGCGQP